MNMNELKEEENEGEEFEEEEDNTEAELNEALILLEDCKALLDGIVEERRSSIYMQREAGKLAKEVQDLLVQYEV